MKTLPKELISAFEEQLAASEKIFDAPSNVKHTEVKKGFGNLIICQTAAYGCRLLFRELKRALAPD